MEVLTAYRSIELGVYAVYPSRKHLTPKVRVLIDFLTARFGPVPPWEVAEEKQVSGVWRSSFPLVSEIEW